MTKANDRSDKAAYTSPRVGEKGKVASLTQDSAVGQKPEGENITIVWGSFAPTS